MLVVGVTGRIGAGKDTISEYLEEGYGFEEMVMGDIAREFAKEEGLEPTRKNLHKIAKKQIGKHGPDFFSKKIVESIKDSDSDKFVVNGVRRPQELPPLEGSFGDGFSLVLVSADPEIRFRRLKRRGRPGDPDTWEEFKEQDRREVEKFRMDDVFEKADIFIENNGTFGDLYSDLDGLVSELL